MNRSDVITCCALTLLTVTATGCAPRFVEVPDRSRLAWVEREIIVESDFLEPSRRRELVRAELTGSQLGPMERVRWIEGINPNSTRDQRTTERHGANAQGPLKSAVVPSASEAGLVQAVFFGVHEGALSAEGELILDAFQGRGDERYFVEFLYRGPMSEVATREMTSAWVSLSKRLAKRGMDPKNLVMGGSKYNQRINAIVLLKVGQ